MTIDNDALVQRLRLLDLDGEAAAWHGLASALAGRDRDVDARRQAGALADLGIEAVPDAGLALLREWVAGLRAQLDQDDLGYQVWLGEPEEAVRDVARWARGFLAGLALLELPRHWPTDPEVRAAVADLNEIARAEWEYGGDADEDEADLATVSEHLKLCALLVHDDLRRQP